MNIPEPVWLAIAAPAQRCCRYPVVGQHDGLRIACRPVAQAKEQSPAKQLAGFMEPYSLDVQTTARAALTKLRAQIPGAVEMVYDTFNALVIGFGPNDRPSAAIVSIALYPNWVNLYLLDGALLPDPERVLKGSGSRVRFLRLDDRTLLDRPAVKTLIAAAVSNADVPFERRRSRRLIIKSIASRRRARRPA
jgi:hypothetical protein